MLSAIPETTWLPWGVIQAKPCTSPMSTDAAIPAASPAHAEPVTAAVAAAANAAASILPSRPMSTMPDRSAKSPPSAASTRGAAPRAVAAASSARSRSDSLIDAGGERSPLLPQTPPPAPRRWLSPGHCAGGTARRGARAARVREIEPDEAAGSQRQEQRQVERRAADVPARGPGQVVELGHPRARGELPRLRRLLTRLDQDVDEEMRHHRRGDEVEHDRRDHDVAAAFGLEPRGHERPGGAAGRRHDDSACDDQRGRPAARAETEQRHAEATDIRLALRSDVEEPTVEGDGDGQTGEDEVGGGAE